MLEVGNSAFVTMADSAIMASGCPERQTGPCAFTVRVTNGTFLDVDPAIRFGKSPDALTALDTGVLAPGESADFELECANAAILTAAGAAQVGLAVAFKLDPLPFFTLDAEHCCGALVEFKFMGNGQRFHVVVTANGNRLF